MASSATAQEADVHGHYGPSIAVVAVVGSAGIAAAVVGSTITYGIDEPAPGLTAVLVAWITLVYVFCGLIAWSRRPESPFGPLMVAAGFAPLLSRLSEVDSSLPQTLGGICRLLPVVAFLHVFLAYPDGRLAPRLERPLVIAGYTSVLGFSFAAMFLGPTNVDSLIAVANRQRPADVLLATARISVAAVALVSLALIVRRARSSGPRLRQSLVRVCFVLALLAITLAVVVRVGRSGNSEVPMRSVAFALIGLAPAILLVGFLRSRLARTAVAGLVVELGRDPTPAALRDAVARTLRDPSLELVYWLPDFGSYADLDGRPVALPEDDGRRRATLIDRDGVHIAAFVHDARLQEERELLGAVTAAAGIALENGRLQAELRARLEELRGSRARIIDAGQTERKRLERNLHDGAQQRLIALSLELGLLEAQLQGDPDATKRLDLARHEIATSLDELRAVARGIHPAVVSGHGLEIALEQLAARGPVPVELKVAIDGRLPERLEVAAFYLVSESLANIGKHANATAATVEVIRTKALVVVEVVDDGVGGADTERGSGLRGLADRVEALDGQLRIWSPAGGGTRLRAEIPCAS
jgi:signal transduction histidine kinase